MIVAHISLAKRKSLFFSGLVFCSTLFFAQSKTESINDTIVCAIDTVTKKVSHKMPIEFSRAVDRYISYTKKARTQYLKIYTQTPTTDETTISYLFDQLTKPVSIDKAVKFLSRARSASNSMYLLQNGQIDENHLAQYEQMCSAIALRCAQSLAECTRIQLLNALQEIDTLLVYWHDQKNHTIKYFFGKSPHKWVMGKYQSQEIAGNIKALERRQAGLFRILGSLTEHMHTFTQCNGDYKSCYTWIEELFSVLACIKIDAKTPIYANVFDAIADLLGLKLRRVIYLHIDSLETISATQKSSHVVRHWIAYTALLAAAGYAGHYYMNDTEDTVKQALLDSVAKLQVMWKGWFVDPANSFFSIAFGKDSGVLVKEMKNKVENIKLDSEKFKSDIAIQLAKSNKSLIDEARGVLYQLLDKAKEDGFAIDVEKIKEAELLGDLKPLCAFYDSIGSWKSVSGLWNSDLKIEVNKLYWQLFAAHNYLEPIKDYAVIIDGPLCGLVEGIAKLVGDFGDFTGDVINDNLWTAKFTALIPLACTSFGLAKTYQYATAKDYSEIRVALAGINSIFIESSMPLDDHDYGKLVYLVHKLMNKAQYQAPTKDNAREEFLVDLEKLESKNFTVAVKRGIIENMFNKYLFLGRDVKSA